MVFLEEGDDHIDHPGEAEDVYGVDEEDLRYAVLSHDPMPSLTAATEKNQGEVGGATIRQKKFKKSLSPKATRHAKKTKTTRKNQKEPSPEEVLKHIRREQRLASFPALMENDTEECRLQRADAMETCWSALESLIEDCLENIDTKTFADILQLAQRSHVTPKRATKLPRYGMHRIPTALALAGGTNAADHTRTFPALSNFLKSQGCYVAHLKPSLFTRSLGDGINEIFKQLTGLQHSTVASFDGILAWYEDELALNVNIETDNLSIHTGKKGLESIQLKQNEGENDVETNPGDDPDDPRAKLRSRSVHSMRKNECETSTNAKNCAINSRINRGRPIVIVVEAVETLPGDHLEDLIFLLSEKWPMFPATLVLGVTTTAAALDTVLPSEILDQCLQCHHFNLSTAVARLDAFVRDVLLSKWCGLLLDGPLIAVLWNLFLEMYFSPKCVIQGFQIAAFSHFRNNLDSHLASLSLDISRTMSEVGQGSNETGNNVAPNLKGRGSRTKQDGYQYQGQEIKEIFVDAIASWKQWALAIHWLVATARFCGFKNGFTYWQLYRDASTPGFGGKKGDLNLLMCRLHNHLLSMNENSKLVELIDKLHDLTITVGDGELISGKDVQTALREISDFRKEMLQNMVLPTQKDKKDRYLLNGISEDVSKETELTKTLKSIGGLKESSRPSEKEIRDTVEELKFQAESKNAKAGTKGHERYLSRTSRRSALLLLSKGRTPGIDGTCTSAEVQLKSVGGRISSEGKNNLVGQHPEKSVIQRFSSWICNWLSLSLASTPMAHPGIRPFLCNDVSSLDCLSAAPRESVHTALLHPKLGKCQNCCRSTGLQEDTYGLSAMVEDVCLAYQIFDQNFGGSNIREWYSTFCEIIGNLPSKDESRTVENTERIGQKAKIRAADDLLTHKSTLKRKNCVRKGFGADDEQDKSNFEKEMSARFVQATAELQMMGLVRATKRKDSGLAVRAVHMPSAMYGI